MASKFLERKEKNFSKKIENLEFEEKIKIEKALAKFKLAKKKDPLESVVFLIVVLVIVMKLMLLGSSLFLPWNEVRDFWVKVSMFQFLVKSVKKLKRIFEIIFMPDKIKEEIKKEKQDEKLLEKKMNEKLQQIDKAWEEENPNYENTVSSEDELEEVDLMNKNREDEEEDENKDFKVIEFATMDIDAKIE